MAQNRKAFTLVEVLVVIAIIGILTALLIPAVGVARETMRRNQCANRLRNLGIAAVQYAGSHQALPGYVQQYGTFGTPVPSAPGTFTSAADPSDPSNFGGAVPPHVKIGPWTVALLSRLDAQPNYEHWTEDRYPIISDGNGMIPNTTGFAGEGFHGNASPNTPLYQCPSNPVADARRGLNSYIANTGMSHLRSIEHPDYSGAGTTPQLIDNVDPGPPTSQSWTSGNVTTLLAALQRTQQRSNGVFQLKYPGLLAAGQLQVGPDMRLEDFKDGLGNTLLFSENVQAQPWHRAGFIDASDVQSMVVVNRKPVLVLPIRSRFTQGMVWHYEDIDCPAISAGTSCRSVQAVHRVNGRSPRGDNFTVQMNRDNAIDLARPSSAHTGGVNIAPADGSTRFLSDSVDYRLYQALLTPRGKTSNVPWPEYVMDYEQL